jgi:hypothetical protein
MEFRIADTFTDGLARLTGEEQKAVKTTALRPKRQCGGEPSEAEGLVPHRGFGSRAVEP